MSTYPTDSEAIASILDIGRRMYQKNFVAANDGNISVRIGPDTILVTPTGVSKGYMSEDTFIKMRLDGTVVSQGIYGPSTEVKMHLRVYRENTDIMAVTHAHPPVCTSFAVAGIGLDKPVYPEALVNLGTVPCLPYQTPGTDGVADSVAPYCKTHKAVLLGNHGALSWGGSLTEAFFRLEAAEHYAMIMLYTGYIIGNANTLTDEQIKRLPI